MKDKIAEVIEKEWRDTSGFLNTDWEKLSQAILDLISKELPKELMRANCSQEEDWKDEGYNQCLKDIKHKLGVK